MSSPDLKTAVIMATADVLARDFSGSSSGNSSSNHEGKTQAQWDAQGRYDYTPSFAAALIFLILYAIILSINVLQYFFYRAWFWWPMLFAVTLELAGYASRAVSVKNLAESLPFILQTVMILVAPAVMAAACYMAFGRIVIWIVPPQYQSARHLWLPARSITPIFVSFDVLSFFVQVVGGSIIAGANTVHQENRGKNIILVGLGLQILTFGFFVFTTIRFWRVLRTKLKEAALPTERNWGLLLSVINAASLTILIRSVYRFIEFAIGVNNYLSDREAFFYCLDAFLILVVAIGFICVHPGMYLPYLGLKRQNMAFSRNADRGILSKFAAGKAAMVPNARSGVEMNSEY